MSFKLWFNCSPAVAMLVIIHSVVGFALLTPSISFATVGSKPGGILRGDDDIGQCEAAGAAGGGQRH